jgi:hypothetical protein
MALIVGGTGGIVVEEMEACSAALAVELFGGGDVAEAASVAIGDGFAGGGVMLTCDTTGDSAEAKPTESGC